METSLCPTTAFFVVAALLFALPLHSVLSFPSSFFCIALPCHLDSWPLTIVSPNS